jgi:RNA polymerase sigma-70 factor (ECF subfamily)
VIRGMSLDRAEADLIRAARDGDGAAFADLLRNEYPVAFRLAYGMLHDANEAEDAVQDAAFKAWRKLGNLHDGSTLRPWLLGIVANQCRTVRRSRRSSAVMAKQPEQKAPETDIEASVDLRRALARLDYNQRLVLVLRYYLDMSFEEIGGTLGVSPKAARTRVERAVHRLRPIVRVQEGLT